MTKRSPIGVLLLSLFTFGIHSLVWFVQTKDEMNAYGADIPTVWLIIIPIISLYWYWKFSEGVDLVTRGAMGSGISFIVLVFFGPLGEAVIQESLNKVAIR